MSAERDTEIAERARANDAEFLEHGPGLRYSTRSWVLARGEGEWLLLGGLGGMGVGWLEGIDRSDDPTLAGAPYDPERRDDFGMTPRDYVTRLLIWQLRACWRMAWSPRP